MSISSLEKSFSIRKTIQKLKKHRYTFSDIQYVFMGSVLLFSFIMIKSPGFLLRLFFASLIALVMLIPATSQFFFNALPIITWLIFFYSTQFLPVSIRPRISVRILPALETIFYGGNLSSMLSQHTSPVLDVLAWVPYGLIHFGAPFVCAGLIFLFAPPRTLPVYAASFGYMNLIGVIIQITCPSAPPWYEILHGLEPATYSTPGSPGGLGRIDSLIGIDMYTSTFTASPLVFGAFPSLHSGSATIEVLFMSHVFPRLTPLFMCYELWIWWATMYLTHHYFIDLMGGAILSCTVFYFARRHLPLIAKDKLWRWNYESIAWVPLKSSARSARRRRRHRGKPFLHRHTKKSINGFSGSRTPYSQYPPQLASPLDDSTSNLHQSLSKKDLFVQPTPFVRTHHPRGSSWGSRRIRGGLRSSNSNFGSNASISNAFNLDSPLNSSTTSFASMNGNNSGGGISANGGGSVPDSVDRGASPKNSHGVSPAGSGSSLGISSVDGSRGVTTRNEAEGRLLYDDENDYYSDGDYYSSTGDYSSDEYDYDYEYADDYYAHHPFDEEWTIGTTSSAVLSPGVPDGIEEWALDDLAPIKNNDDNNNNTSSPYSNQSNNNDNANANNGPSTPPTQSTNRDLLK